MVNCTLRNNFQWNFNKDSNFFILEKKEKKCIWKCRLLKWWPFCSGGDELIDYMFDVYCSDSMTKTPFFMGLYGAAFSDITISHQPIIRGQYGAFQNKPSDLCPIDLWSHFGNERQKTPQDVSLGFEDEARWLAKLLALHVWYEVENRPWWLASPSHQQP